MSAPAITLAAVRKFNPCTESYTRISAILPKRGKITAQQAVRVRMTAEGRPDVLDMVKRPSTAGAPH